MSAPLGLPADLTGVTMAALKAEASRLGLTWSLQTATVVNGLAPSAVALVVDGDTVAIPAISMVGVLAADRRVFVVNVPPSGTYVVGFVGTVPLKMTNLIFKRASADLTLTASDVAVANTLTTVIVGDGPVTWEATAFFDFQETAVPGAASGVGSLYVDGVAQTGNAVYTMQVVGDRATVGAEWSGTFAAGTLSHTFGLRALKGGGATIRTNANSTTMNVKTYE